CVREDYYGSYFDYW
nr:immunoglobulin heavy chain junction region [Mus musculus]